MVEVLAMTQKTKVSITLDTRPFERMRLALDRFVHAFGLALGYPTREDRARQQRIYQHMARCAQRRERRRRRGP